ncbi:hypothetical protein HMPREF1556_00270, partial [Porphyromonas sp. oral taxon 278 str. W7784]
MREKLLTSVSFLHPSKLILWRRKASPSDEVEQGALRGANETYGRSPLRPTVGRLDDLQ